MITTPKTLTDLDLHNVTGGNLTLTPRGDSGGGGSLLGKLGSGLSNLWSGTKNQASKTKDAWSGFAKMPFEGFAKMISPH
jgi:hypothetical protein